MAAGQHPLKREHGYTYADCAEETPEMLGVCDGVSGVQRMGIPPDLLPRELLTKCREVLDRRRARLIASGMATAESSDGHWLMGCLQEAYDATSAPGATTVLVAALEGGGRRLAVASIGDCGLLLLRHHPSYSSTTPGSSQLTKVLRTDPLRYQANRPVQISRLPNVSTPEVHLVIAGARMNLVQCMHNDLVVVGSDGVFDNLSDEEIARIVDSHCRRRHAATPRDAAGTWPPPTSAAAAPTVGQLEKAAEALVSAAMGNVRPELLQQDHEVAWWEAAAHESAGGNADDTTVIVAALVEEEEAAYGTSPLDDDSFVLAHRDDPRRSPRERGDNGGGSWGSEGTGFPGILYAECCTGQEGTDDHEVWWDNYTIAPHAETQWRTEEEEDDEEEPAQCSVG